MKLKKILALVLLTSLLASCGNTSNANSSNDQKNDETTTTTTSNSEDYNIVTQEEVENSDSVIIDARPQYEYSGWDTSENSFGGHIEGATDFPAELLYDEYDDNNNLEDMTREDLLEMYMDEKGIDENSSVIIYDENGQDAKDVANFLSTEGVSDISLFDLNDWTGDLVSYENYDMYVPPVVVKQLIDGEQVDEIDSDNLVVLEVSWGTIEQSDEYLKGHVPTAIHVNTDDFEDADNLYTLDEDSKIFDLAKSEGITTDSTVIVTGTPIYACRYATILQYLGVDDVHVMSGGVNGWTDAGYELETTVNEGTPVDDFGTDTPLNPDLIDTVDEAEQYKDQDDFTLVDVRTKEEFDGEISGYSYWDTKGTIEGAISSPSGIKDSSSMIYYEYLNESMRNGYEIIQMLEDAGVDTNTHMSFYCGGGYRAAVAEWDLRVMGYNDVSLFSDGWIGWSYAGKDYVTGQQ